VARGAAAAGLERGGALERVARVRAGAEERALRRRAGARSRGTPVASERLGVLRATGRPATFGDSLVVVALVSGEGARDAWSSSSAPRVKAASPKAMTISRTAAAARRTVTSWCPPKAPSIRSLPSASLAPAVIDSAAEREYNPCIPARLASSKEGRRPSGGRAGEARVAAA